jgi:hypothetical protein
VLSHIDKEIHARKNWIDFSEVLSDNGKKLIKRGQLLGFKKDNVITYYKAMRINKKSDIFLFKQLPKLFTPEEIEAIEKEGKTVQEVIQNGSA